MQTKRSVEDCEMDNGLIIQKQPFSHRLSFQEGT